jgi:hypothetical protein
MLVVGELLPGNLRGTDLIFCPLVVACGGTLLFAISSYTSNCVLVYTVPSA